MNAGAMGAQTFENVTRVRYLDAEGNSHVKNRDELEVFYRRFPLLEKTLQFLQRSAATSRARRNRYTFARIAGETAHDAAVRQKCRLHFKNPATIPAGKLVDELGLKNSRVGIASPSFTIKLPYTANFI